MTPEWRVHEGPSEFQRNTAPTCSYHIHERLSQHRGYVTRQTQDATGKHFNLPGHKLSNMKITVLEQVKNQDPIYRKEREKYHIRKFNSYHKGMNGSPGLGLY